jgi:hypothetical protein
MSPDVSQISELTRLALAKHAKYADSRANLIEPEQSRFNPKKM